MDVQTNDAAFSVIGFSSRRRAVQIWAMGKSVGLMPTARLDSADK